MSGGRTVCGMGRGDSALRYIGLKPKTLATMEASMDVVRALVRGDEVELNDKTLSIPWIEHGYDLPMWGAGYGPKALTLIGRKCDGFILQLADPYLVEWTSKFVKNAAVEAGRNPDDIKICVAAPAYVGDDIAHQRDQVRWFGGMVGNHVADLVERYGDDESMIPTALSDYIKTREGYDYDHHGKAGNPDIQPGVDIVIGPGTEIIAGEGRIVTAGGIDAHIHWISPQQVDEALYSGITTMLGGGTGPATGIMANPIGNVRKGPHTSAFVRKCPHSRFGHHGRVRY